MEIEAQLESIDKKIESYNTKIDNISSLITTLIHSFQQNQLPNFKTEIVNTIEEKFQDTSIFPNIEEIKKLFNEIKKDLSENQNNLKIKIIELEKIIEKINKAISNLSENKETFADEGLKKQLQDIEESLEGLANELAIFKNSQTNVQIPVIEKESSIEKIEDIKTLISSQNSTNISFQQNIENYIKSIEEKIKEITKTPFQNKEQNITGMNEIKERFDDLNLAITSVLSAIKIIDKKYTELKNFQEVIDKLTTDVVSPILLASSDIKSFIEATSQNFSEINNFVKEYDKGAFIELQNKIQNMHGEISNLSETINNNLDKIVDTVNIDVNRLFDLVDEFKTNSDLSNHTISDNMEKIENMLAEYNENLEELTKSSTADVIKDGIKSLNDEFYLELLSLFNSLSFDDEAEDLKDFIENVLSAITVKTNENSEKLNNIMLQFKSLLNKIEGIEKAQNSITDYLKPEDTSDLVYSFDDIQSDLAKMRLVLNDISKSVTSSDIVEEISDKIRKTGEQIEQVSKLLGNTTEADEGVTDIRQKIEDLNAQVYDISLRTNKLILSNEDSTIELKNNLEIFKEVFDKANPEKLYELFYELTHYLNEINEKISEGNQSSKAVHAEASTIKNALIYVGEWLDNATTVLEELRANSEELLNKRKEIEKTETEIEGLKKSINNDVTNIFARLKIYEEETQKRLDKIEEKIDKILTVKITTKETSTKPINTKLDNINKKFVQMEEVLSELSSKLAKE